MTTLTESSQGDEGKCQNPEPPLIKLGKRIQMIIKLEVEPTELELMTEIV
jgi:hypothetical protein